VCAADRRVRPAAGPGDLVRALSALLLLFDIDGTLVQRAADAHRLALYDALREVFGIEEPEVVHVRTAGKTDGQIARELLLGHGVAEEEVDRRAVALRDAWWTAYEAGCEEDLSHTVAPGVPDLLSWLADRPDVRLALLTGNLEPIARLKLARAGLGHFFAPGQGAFGSDHESRAELPAVARARAGGWPRERTAVIGDTPLDIACARADGVRVAAVATGAFGVPELGEADAAVPDARALRAVLEDWLEG